MNTKTIVITGSTRGIGFGLAKEFLRLDNELVINGRSSVTTEEVVNQLKLISEDVTGIAGSVSLEETHVNLINTAVSTFGKIDIWINNAGVPQPHSKFIDIETCHIQQVAEVNIAGSLMGTKLAAGFMVKQGFGKIFNMEGFGSDGRMLDKLSLYGTTKRAINYFSRSVAKELEGTNVQLGIIQPGMVRTDFLNISMDAASEKEKKQFEKVHRILAEDVDKVTSSLAPKILASSKNYDRIEFLSKFQMMGKIFRLIVS